MAKGEPERSPPEADPVNRDREGFAMPEGDDHFHPVAGLFPMLEADDFAALVEDIRLHGVREPIVRHRDGRVLDGRNRLLACRQLGVPCPERSFEGDDSDVLSFVVSMNLHRRHLDASQRAMIAGELANLGEGRPPKSRQICPVSQSQAAGLLSVSSRSVRDAVKVRREGVPELVRAVKQGRLSVSRAAAATKRTPEQQRRIAAGDPLPHCRNWSVISTGRSLLTQTRWSRRRWRPPTSVALSRR
jgi:ParB-like chromosome segregation protein Spo0J